ncbi:MAG: DNA methyltransferase [Coprococcus sp.]
MAKVEKHINYALVEAVRPAMYKPMKYWGKKPHNIWSDFIACYCPEDGVVLDPFMGSGIVAFESLILGRKAITFDLNPLSEFFIETTLEKFDEEVFKKAVERIVKKIEADKVYIENYTKKIDGEETIIYNYIWFKNEITKIRAKNLKGEDIPDLVPDVDDKRRGIEMEQIKMQHWYPTDKLPLTPSINQKFITDLGGDDFSYLWTRRNLYLLSEIFNCILNEDKKVVKHLLAAFVHTLHLVCKMVYPRAERGDRRYSGSWGRADYMIRNKSMEQNPLIIFQRSCFDRQGIVKAMNNAKERLPEKRTVNEVSRKKQLNLKCDLNYGNIDVADLCDYVEDKSVDFILTDPPYGGLVQYIDLSQIWLVWLQKYDKKYKTNNVGEITVKKGYIGRDEYRRKLVNAFKNMHRVLKDDGYMVVTFHSQEMQDWNDFVNCVRNAGFKFDKVTHQYNKRSGESNVAMPYGTTGSDFYIRCVKKRTVDFTDDKSELEHFILQKTIEIIAERNEKTPFTFIVNGLLPELLQAGYLSIEEPRELQDILKKYVGKDNVFCVTYNSTQGAGDYWWFNEPKKYINYPNIPLSKRVEETVLSIMRRRISVKYDDIVAEIFKNFPNGLTPDPRGIKKTVEKYAVPVSGKWKLQEDVIKESTKHTQIIYSLAKLGKKNGYKIFIGKREQSERYQGNHILCELNDVSDMNEIMGKKFKKERIDRINMIDTIWINENDIQCIFEVENSTNFTMALQRASNLDCSVKKFMVIPEDREAELRAVKDPIFINLFAEYNWKYLTYNQVMRMVASKSVDFSTIEEISKTLED